MKRPHVLLVSGSLRRGSTNTAAVRTAANGCGPDAALRATVYGGLRELPHFDPDDDSGDAFPHPAVAGLRSAIAAADALLFCTPEYAGALPGSFKNLLDWSVGGGEIYEKPVGWVNASASPTGAANAHASLQIVLGYVGARIVDAACVHVPVARSAVGADGLIDDPAIRERLARVLATLVRS